MAQIQINVREGTRDFGIMWKYECSKTFATLTQNDGPPALAHDRAGLQGGAVQVREDLQQDVLELSVVEKSLDDVSFVDSVDHFYRRQKFCPPKQLSNLRKHFLALKRFQPVLVFKASRPNLFRESPSSLQCCGFSAKL